MPIHMEVEVSTGGGLFERGFNGESHFLPLSCLIAVEKISNKRIELISNKDSNLSRDQILAGLLFLVSGRDDIVLNLQQD